MPDPIAFNVRVIDSLAEAPPGARVYYEDPRIPSLRLSVTDKGLKSWVVQKRIGARVARITLGRYPDLTPENARRRAEQVIGQIAEGKDPQADKREARAGRLKFGEAFEEMLRRRPLKPKTQTVYRQVINAALGDWLTKPLVEISKDMVAERHAKLALRSPTYADSAMRTFRSIWNFAAAGYEDRRGESLLGPNPVDRLSKTKAWHRLKRRDTFIREQDLPSWFGAVQTLRAESLDSSARTIGDYLALLILTGLRRSEGIELQWCNVDLAARTLRVVDTKNHDDHVLPLSDFVLELLRARHDGRSESRFVFPGKSPLQPMQEPRAQVARVIRTSGVDFTIHDLRRTFCTVAESLDLSHYALKRLLNHRMAGDVTAGYIGKNVERLRNPMQRITSYILSAAGTRPSARIIPIGDGAAMSAGEHPLQKQ